MDGMYKDWSNRAAPVFLQHGACCQHGLIIISIIIIITRRPTIWYFVSKKVIVAAICYLQLSGVTFQKKSDVIS